MDDLSFNIPRKIFEFLIIVALIIASIWGLITWDSNKAAALFFKQTEIITKPIINRIMKRMDRLTSPLFELIIPQKSQEEL